MTTLALPTLNTQEQNLEAEITKYSLLLKEKRAELKAIADKQKLAIKVMAKIETALIQFQEAKEELGEAATELVAVASQKINEYFSNEQVRGNEQEEVTSTALRSQSNEYRVTSNEYVLLELLVKSNNLKTEQNLLLVTCYLLLSFPTTQEEPTTEGKQVNLVSFPKKPTKNNEYFRFELTKNSQVAYIVNIKKAKNQAVYIGANNKNNLKSVESNLMRLFEISCAIRPAERLSYTYELKITGLEDDAIGWLTQFDFSQPFYPQFATTLKKPEIPEELKLTENNWVASKGAVIVNNLFNYKCCLLEKDNFGEGIAKDNNGNKFNILLDDWHLEQDFKREAEFTYSTLMACKNKKELETIKNSNQVDKDFVKFVYHNMPKESKEKIDKMCQQKLVKAN